ncbi:MAG: hypothetical protein JXR49_08925 [Acidobacteria bacterium]|nr:hypothetical protein [Acidobacteriota bacterium]
MLTRKIVLAAVVCTAMLSGPGLAHAADPCDRACLEGYIDKVLDAMIERDPEQLMLAKDVRYTENGVALIPGDGLWGTASARGNYSLYVCDPEAGQVGFYGTLIELGNMDYIALRVKVFEALIEEIEVIVVRPGGTMPGPDGQPALSVGQIVDLQKPRRQFLETVPKDERMSREDLIKVANWYFTGLANQTGKFTAPFADSCERLENGTQSTNQKPDPNTSSGALDILSMGCEEQQKSGWFAFVTEIRNRRFPVVDIERGLVLAFGFFDHDAAVRSYPLPDGTMIPNIISYPQTIEISELFQIRKGKIDQIEAVINSVPYGMKSEVWDK